MTMLAAYTVKTPDNMERYKWGGAGENMLASSTLSHAMTESYSQIS